jgi:hypothetical protein
LVTSAACWNTVFVVIEEGTPADVVTVRDTVNVALAPIAGTVSTGFCAVADENVAPVAEHVHDH